MRVLSLECSNAESHYQQLDKLRLIYEEYIKTCKDVIPNDEKEFEQLNEELDKQSQALDDVIIMKLCSFCLLKFLLSFSSLHQYAKWKPQDVTETMLNCFLLM